MKRAIQILKIIIHFILLPFTIIFTGSKKRAYRRIKKRMVAANLL